MLGKDSWDRHMYQVAKGRGKIRSPFRRVHRRGCQWATAAQAGKQRLRLACSRACLLRCHLCSAVKILNGLLR